MDPVTLITGAIAAGAVEALKETTSAAVKDAYGKLKSLIQKRFSGKNNPEGDGMLAQYEKNPDTWKKPLSKALTETGADRDESISEAAEALIQAIKESPGGPKVIAKYHLENCTVGVLGDGHVFNGPVNVGFPGK